MKNNTSFWTKYLPWMAWLWFYLGWFLCLKMAEQNQAVLTLLIPALSWTLLALQMRLTKRLSGLLLFLTLLGLVFDRILHSFSFVTFKTEFVFGFVPIWLVSVWLMFAVALPLLIKQFQGPKKFWVGLLLAGLFAPLSYKSGENFHLIEVHGSRGLIALSAEWILYFGICLKCPIPLSDTESQEK